MEKRGVSLLAVIMVLLILIAVIWVGIKVFKNGVNNEVIGKVVKIFEKEIPEKEKFSFQMLEENGLGENAKIEQLKSKFENLKQTATYVETSTGKNVEEYSASGIKIILKNNKIYVAIITKEDFEFNGIKIGDSVDKVLESFFKDETSEDVMNAEGEVIGKYIYGNYIIDSLENIEITNEVQYAYIGNEKTAYNGLYDYIVQYACMEPPYKEKSASKKDRIAYIEFGIKDGVVKSFASQIER